MVTLDADRGEAILPCLGQEGKLLGYGHSAVQTQSEIKEGKPKQWQLIVANFDAATTQLGERLAFNLGGEPLSIAWDRVNDRWLVVTPQKMLWVKQVGGNLQSTPIAELRWNQIALHPVAAAISSQQGQIALAAELATPQIYEQTRCVVQTMIFLWDGKSQQLQPLYDPSLNSLPRHVFPETKSPWAKIAGNIGKFGLSGLVDTPIMVAPDEK